MIAGTVITQAGTVVVHGRTVALIAKLAARDAELAGMEFGSVEFRAAGPKLIYTISHSTLEK